MTLRETLLEQKHVSIMSLRGGTTKQSQTLQSGYAWFAIATLSLAMTIYRFQTAS
jgi:hypothetical protein